MVKPELDNTVDYYALLNISSKADAEEIKKSYRKMGMYLEIASLTFSTSIPS